LGRNLSAHPLGGCKLGTASSNSVTNADRSAFGSVHNYSNLYVADGALVPSSIGANPSLTIGALAEMVAEGITGVAPTTAL
ncbi:MAG TPA: GMC oxidoreductase, partial [Polyangiales bacterium]